jgi:hypothetical protein
MLTYGSQKLYSKIKGTPIIKDSVIAFLETTGSGRQRIRT